MIFQRKWVFVTGIAMVILGTFLPWWSQGDLISIWSYGIQVFPIIQDNGGVIILLLTLIVIASRIQYPNRGKNSSLVGILAALALAATSVHFIFRMLASKINASGIVGPPEIEVGLAVVLCGSILLLFTTWQSMVNHKKPSPGRGS